MSETRKQKLKAEALVSCLSCGQTSSKFVSVKEGGGVYAKTACPKCNCTAYVHNITGLWAFMEAAARQIASLKLDMLDVQDDGEER